MKQQKIEKRTVKDFLNGSIAKRHLSKASSQSAEVEQDFWPPRETAIH